MDINQENELLKQMMKSFIKELTYTKKGKFSQRKFNKNKNPIFEAMSFVIDYNIINNKEEIKKFMQEHMNQYADIRDIKFENSEVYQFKTEEIEDLYKPKSINYKCK